MARSRQLASIDPITVEPLPSTTPTQIPFWAWLLIGGGLVWLFLREDGEEEADDDYEREQEEEEEADEEADAE